MLADDLFVAPSAINGSGVFTKRKILADEIFYQVPLDVIFNQPVPHCAKIGDQKWVSDERVLNFVNHSCDPNMKLIITTSPPVLQALRDIEVGEEIVCDYLETEDGEEKNKCTCGTKKCRRFFPI